MVQKTLSDAQHNNGNKKIYIKPELTQVQLVAEQAVIALCKTGSATGRDDCIAAGGTLTCSSSGTS